MSHSFIQNCRWITLQVSHHEGWKTRGKIIIVSRILYALPACHGFLAAELTNKSNGLFRRLKRFGYATCNITASDLIDTSGRDLFRCSSEHSLHHLLPPERKYSNLRNRGHPYELPEYCTNLHKKSYYSIIVFVHLIFLNICELSFNRDFAHCWRAFDMSNKYYLLTYLLKNGR